MDGLEERRNGGDPLANLPQRFRTGTLSAAHAAALRRVCDHASAEEAQELIGTMRSCLLDQFVPAGESGGMHSDSLYLYLEWAGFDAACFADFPQVHVPGNTFGQCKSTHFQARQSPPGHENIPRVRVLPLPPKSPPFLVNLVPPPATGNEYIITCTTIYQQYQKLQKIPGISGHPPVTEEA